MDKEKMLALRLTNRRTNTTYKAKVATNSFKTISGSQTKQIDRRGSVILVEESINVLPLKERSHNGVELIGIKLVGDTDNTYTNPFELWTIYSPPYKSQGLACRRLVKKLCAEMSDRILLAGDFNSNLSIFTSAENWTLKTRRMLEEVKLSSSDLISPEKFLDLCVNLKGWNKIRQTRRDEWQGKANIIKECSSFNYIPWN